MSRVFKPKPKAKAKSKTDVNAIGKGREGDANRSHSAGQYPRRGKEREDEGITLVEATPVKGGQARPAPLPETISRGAKSIGGGLFGRGACCRRRVEALAKALALWPTTYVGRCEVRGFPLGSRCRLYGFGKTGRDDGGVGSTCSGHPLDESCCHDSRVLRARCGGIWEIEYSSIRDGRLKWSKEGGQCYACREDIGWHRLDQEASPRDVGRRGGASVLFQGLGVRSEREEEDKT
jgi:hypothetical protein